ncbi:MAG: thiamine phosphate synthase [Candidatus Omnitrophica bacterium]|nr:thiamine phosphate synthase [Candidatus Omnitrophota bacterium]
MNLKKKLFENFNLYAVTLCDGPSPDILSQVDKAYRGGAGIVQLRTSGFTDRELIRLGLKIRQVSRHHGKGFVVNNRVDIALAVDADGVHIGQNDAPVDFVRECIQKYGSLMLIGKSTHSLEQAEAAQEEGVDYIGVGPIFATPTKPDYSPVGLELIHQVKRKMHIPFVAIGGIHELNMDQVIEAGASAIAVVRAIFSAPDAFLAAKTLREKYDKLRLNYV